MKLTVTIAKKLLQLTNGEPLNRSELNTLAAELVGEGIVLEKIAGRTRRTLLLSNKQALDNWLFNKYGINDLQQYITITQQEEPTRAENIQAAGNSKLSSVRTFKGFLVNAPHPIQATLNGEPLTLHNPPGTFQFIYDYEAFALPADVLVVGVENAELFRRADKLCHLFSGRRPLFVSRYPQQQGKDVIRWLQNNPNLYTHLGDYDFAGINIYVQEYKKHLGDRATFFIPHNIETLLQNHRNTRLYDRQKLNAAASGDLTLQPLIALLHKYKNALEQEILLLNK